MNYLNKKDELKRFYIFSEKQKIEKNQKYNIYFEIIKKPNDFIIKNKILVQLYKIVLCFNNLRKINENFKSELKIYIKWV